MAAHNPGRSKVEITRDVGGAELQIGGQRERLSSDVTAPMRDGQGLVHTNSQPIAAEAWGGKQQSKGEPVKEVKSDEKAREKVKSQQHRGETEQGGEGRMSVAASADQ